MIQITQLKLPADHKPEELKEKAARALRISPQEIRSLTIRKQSLDARKKPELFYIYTVDVETAREQNVVHKAKSPQVMIRQEKRYQFPKPGPEVLRHRPAIIGTGPAGLFCGLMLARAGYAPLLLERGEDVDTRQQKVRKFWESGQLDARSNVQFGEGGAGTFSDGKLNTLVKDPACRNLQVLRLLVEFGADPAILYQNKPHIGTDVLSGIVKGIRQEIIRLGGQVRFGCRAADFLIEQNRIAGVITETGETIPAEAVVLAVGHSSRDTFEMLLKRQVPMEAKAFAVGLRIQHPQRMMNLSQYGREEAGALGAASYKLTSQTGNGRGVYSFCMCPGGYVVNASSEEGMLAVNGMSYHARDGVNANSALIVTVTPGDYPDGSPLGGVAFQRKLERLAFQAGGSRIPVQLWRDFRKNQVSRSLGAVEPQFRGGWTFANLRTVLPEPLSASLMEAMEKFGQMIQGFDRPDALFAGVESRTSSPVRIPRDEGLESAVRGLYPCGEGAGYAGGITSAAMDGLKVAEMIAAKYHIK